MGYLFGNCLVNCNSLPIDTIYNVVIHENNGLIQDYLQLKLYLHIYKYHDVGDLGSVDSSILDTMKNI